MNFEMYLGQHQEETKELQTSSSRVASGSKKKSKVLLSTNEMEQP